jgi:endo-1,4-beta-xylanase
MRNRPEPPHVGCYDMNTHPVSLAFVACSVLLTAGTLTGGAAQKTGNPKPPTLKDAYKNDFLIGVALNQRQFTEQDTNGAALVKAQFNSITPENVL